MKVYRVALFGHREMNDCLKTEEKLCALVRDLLRTEQYVEFYIGRHGEFDILAASVVKRERKIFGKEKCGLTLVLPYSDKDMEYYDKYYDSIIIPECLNRAYPKGAITKRNRWMVEECDLIVCYVERESGGASTALKYAKRLEKDIVNLATQSK